ncbi:MAG: hypothetical protein WC291_04615 [Thermodesulfovibrionales bacterium]|jgi:hypothetical protein
MDEHSDTFAQESFEENIRLFAPPSQRPEQYNLYNGLAHLSLMVQQVLAHVRELERRLAQLEK